MRQRRILLGHVSAAHGIRGEVLVKTQTGAPEDIAAYGPLEDEAGSRTLKLKVLRVTPKGVIARIEGVTDRNAAEALRGVKLFVPREKLPPPEAGEWYHADLIGLAAADPEGKPLGEVIGVANYGAGDLLEVRVAGSGKVVLVPFANPHVPEVDVAGGRVVIAPTPGLLD